jgi:hypothetical protein
VSDPAGFVTDPAEFIRQYAIRLPDGRIARSPYGTLWTWDERDDAERALGFFRQGAERVGVNEWTGEIVHQLCTPWIGDHDRTTGFIDELTTWLEKQIGEQP